MNTKNISFAIGGILVFLAMVTVFPNPIIGDAALFRTDFAHNLLHFLSGVAILFVALQYERHLGKTLRVLGIFYLALAVFGATTTGSGIGKVLGFMEVGGAGHILHLIIGVALVALGTREIRVPPEDGEVEEDAEDEYNPLSQM